MLIKSIRLVPGTGGAGRYRGSPPSEITFGPRRDTMTAVITSDCNHFAPKGVRGGHDGVLATAFLVDDAGNEEKLANVVQLDLRPGQWIRGHESSGGGYGDPRTRDPARVRDDVLEGWETIERARDVYGVALTGHIEDETLAVDAAATARLRT